MANKISTVRTYPLNGAVNFTITFEYLARKFVQVTLIGKDRKELVLNQDYRFTTKTQITTSRTWTAADGYQMVEIRRFTSATDRLVDFADGSILRAYDLNISQVQTLHVAEEARDLTADTIGVNNDGHLDARGRKIVNLAFATDDYDAVPLKQVKERESSAWDAVTKADGHANRSRDEANLSRDEADRSKREADRSTQQAGVSTQQAVESKKQADRSNSEANIAKGYADSMTASVAEAKKQADRSDSEANRARDEANRAAGEVTKATAEVAKAAAHVETAKGHADRANTEANRSKSEADRAKTEADKLGNMNDFSGTVETVEGVTPTFKSGLKLRTGDFYAERGGFISNTEQPRLNLQSTSSDNTGTTVVFGSQSGANDWYVGRANKGSADVNLHSYQNNTTLSLRADGVHSNKDFFIDGNLYIKKYGTYIDEWVNNRLSEHAYNKGEVNNLVNGRLTAGQGDDRYVRKNAGWDEVWSGSAVGGVSVGLSQDVRWRTIWIQTNNRWNAYPIGDNGSYFISSDGGWLMFTISNNGRTFRNDQDRRSVPTRILVQNQ
ncbi:tail fiber protein [Enterobacter phage vB_SEqdws-315]|uniref:Tail fiber protein n=1 Tax=Enterobacter phage vB_SEqdws-315 TaxID=2894396 RepID=A0AAE8YF25_9CAUD|nr:tail fiber protein [Enterobacter phage vB_SEqdws-315]